MQRLSPAEYIALRRLNSVDQVHRTEGTTAEQIDFYR